MFKFRNIEKKLVLVYTGLDVMAEPADSIGAAPLTMPHLADVFFALVLHLSLHFRCRWGDIGKFILGNKWYDIEGIDTHLPDLLCDLGDMILVYSWNVNRIDLDDHLSINCHLDAPELVFEEELSSFNAGEAFALVGDVFIDLRPDFRVDRIQGYGNVTNPVFLEKIDLLRKEEAVCTDTFDYVGELFMRLS
jgi:hypothetical protein